MNPSAQPLYRFGPFNYDSGQRLLFRGDELVSLAPKVAETLHVLLQHHGTIVEKAELMREVWPDTTVEEVGLARNISQLRKALGDEGEDSHYIETLPRRGYRFVGEVETDSPGTSKRAGAKPILPPALRWFLLSAVALCVILGLVYWQFYRPSRYLPSGAHTARIAVVPFECMSPELDCYVFPRGLTDLLVTDLSRIQDVEVLSPSTVYRFQRTRLSMPFMARLLRQDMMLEGSIQRAGDQVRITARLVDVHSATLVWSDTHEYPLQKLPDAQEQAARDIAAKVGAHLAARDQALPANH
jgi:DNA-binding winged helix-turn-helix (wHTH) protein/TolB-like protein